MKPLQELVKETAPFAIENRGLTWFHLISTLLILAGFVYLTTLSEIALWARICCSLFAGGVLVRLFIIYHDFQHGAIFSDSAVAKVILDFYGILVLNPAAVWNRSHNYHHAKNSQIATASIGSFPIMTVADYRAADWKTRIMYRLSRGPIPFLAGHVLIFIVGMCLKSFATDPKRHWDSMVALIIHGTILGLLISKSWELAILAYLLPLYLACMAGAYLFYIQHNFPDMKLRPRDKWEFGYAALKSSSFMDGNPLIHWLTGNIGYHHVHHLNSRIPFYRLPEAMAGISELQNPGRTSLAPWDIYRCMRLKLWDPAADRMISFSEARPQLRQQA